MTITKRGKCDVCKTPCSETKDFQTTVDMFNPHAERKITKEIQADIIAWREEPILCREHI